MIVLINGDYQTFVGSDEDGSPMYEPYFLMPAHQCYYVFHTDNDD